MKNKFSLILLFLVVIFMSGCTSQGEPSKEDVLKKINDGPKSEYDVCMDLFNEKWDFVDQCEISEVEAQGYTDGLDCIEEFDDPICDDSDRYNAQVGAYNGCLDEADVKYPDYPSMIDCLELVQT